jgi:hypothetical protein
MANHMMLDLETLATTPRAAVMQVGLAIFNPDGGYIDTTDDTAMQPVEVNVDVQSCISNGGEVSGDTVRWWLLGTQATRASVAAQGVPINDALFAIKKAWSQYDCKFVWAHGSVFDVPIVEYYARRLGIPVPWMYWQIRDTRTLFDIAECLGWVKEKRPTAHTAAADAVAQAQDVQAAVAFIRELRWPTSSLVKMGTPSVEILEAIVDPLAGISR